MLTTRAPIAMKKSKRKARSFTIEPFAVFAIVTRRDLRDDEFVGLVAGLPQGFGDHLIGDLFDRPARLRLGREFVDRIEVDEGLALLDRRGGIDADAVLAI